MGHVDMLHLPLCRKILLLKVSRTEVISCLVTISLWSKTIWAQIKSTNLKNRKGLYLLLYYKREPTKQLAGFRI